MSLERKFFKMVEHDLEHFKIVIRGEFEVKSENTDFIHKFKIESDRINKAIKELNKEINIAVLEKCKDIIKDLMK